jgi:CHRD domain-containing protein
MRKALIGFGVTVASLAAALAAIAAPDAGTTKLVAAMRGGNEKPAAPASNKGKAEIRLTPSSGKVCWELKVGKIDGQATQAHIHKGGKAVSGPVVVPLGANFKRQGCTTAPKATVKAILKSPGAFYVNVHNAKHPLGAMRAQLVRGT